MFVTHAPLQPMGEVCTHNPVDSHKVKMWSTFSSLHIYIYSVHTWTKKARGRGGEGAAHPAQLTPKCHEGGGALFPWKPSLSNILF